jgi:hypothetical protein
MAESFYTAKKYERIIADTLNMTMKTYAAIAALAAIALLIGAFALPATVSDAYAQKTKVTINQEQSNQCTGFAGCTNNAAIIFGSIG